MLLIIKKATLIPSSKLASLLTSLYSLTSDLRFHLDWNSAEVSGSPISYPFHSTITALLVQICYEHLTEKLKNNAVYYCRTLDVLDAKNSSFQQITQAYLEKISSHKGSYLRKPITKRKGINGKLTKAKKESLFSGQNQCLLSIKQNQVTREITCFHLWNIYFS